MFNKPVQQLMRKIRDRKLRNFLDDFQFQSIKFFLPLNWFDYSCPGVFIPNFNFINRNQEIVLFRLRNKIHQLIMIILRNISKI